VRVGVIDTGLDYHHPDLGGGFGPNFRVSSGHDFVGNGFTGGNTPVPDADPDDCVGHGTHVAGIIGANGTHVGVAPGVTFGAYRVFGCSGSTTSDILIAAMERALNDGMQVVNISIGSAFAWPQYPTATAADRLVNKGVVVVASIGNEGMLGLYSASAPGLGKKVIGVGSIENNYVNMRTFTVSPDARVIPYFPAPPPLVPNSGTFPMARTGSPTSTADACVPVPPPGSLAGKVALIRRSVQTACSPYLKARNAQAAGAVGVVIYNNAPGNFTVTVPTPPGQPPITIPVALISAAEGILINNRIVAGPTFMTWTGVITPVPNSNGGLISPFSSYGLSPDLALKPDISAPGGWIRSTYPLELGGTAILSGTSMASPHVAGAVALLLEAHPHTSSQAVNRILQNSADPIDWWVNPSLGLLESVHRQGAGQLDIDDAILANTMIEPGNLALGESEGAAVRTLTVENPSDFAVSYTLSHAPAQATGPNTFPPVSFFDAPSSVAFSENPLVVPPGGSASVDVTISPNPTLPDRSAFGGYIVFATDEGAVYRVPYAGFKGDYQSIPVLVPTAAGFPWLGKLVGNSVVSQPAGASYTMVGLDVPLFILHLDHQPRRVRMELFDSGTGRAWHRALDDEYIPRSAGATSAFLIPWNGETANGNRLNEIPNGTYLMKVTIEKALAEESNANHFETWTSPVITIARP
jgi:subtilisin family serine protease